MIKIKTNFSVAYDSNDHLTPYGCVRDSNTNYYYIEEVSNYFNNKKLNVLDIGCAGGQLIIDHHNRGDVAVGIEGSSHALNGAGSKNWQDYHNKNLFLCDASRPYEIQDENTLLKFDYIQCWEVLEHIPTERLHLFLTNVKNHLNENGIFCGSISQVDCSSGTHVSIFPKDRWTTIFNDAGLSMDDYIFVNRLRNENHALFFTSKLL